MTYPYCNSDLVFQVISEVRERVRQYQITWFDHGLRTGKIYEKMARELLPTLHLSTRRENVFNLQLLLANLRVVEDRVSLRVPMHPTHWTRNRQRRTTSGMPRIIKRMLDERYIDRKVMPRSAKKASEIWCSLRLLKLLSPLPLPAYGPVELIVLRDANGEPQDFAETEHTRTLRKWLKEINRINGQAEIGFGYPVQTQLHAVFNEDFTQGGRLYTSGLDHLQGLEGWKRLRLTINGESVVELDFSGYHPHLMYAMEGLQFAGDPYDLGGATEHPVGRKFAKIALQCLINAKDRTEAERAANNWVHEHPENMSKLRELGLYPARRILRGLERRHKPIRHCFAGSGPQLANLDAKIAMNIVLHFINQGIPCLPVHDSFLVQERYESELRRVMLDTYKEYANGFTIPIQKKVDL